MSCVKIFCTKNCIIIFRHEIFPNYGERILINTIVVGSLLVKVFVI